MAPNRLLRPLPVVSLMVFVWCLVHLGLPDLNASPQSTQSPQQNRAFVVVDGTPEHRIGRNDVLRITVWDGRTVAETSVIVAEDGTIFVPFGIDRNFKVDGLSSTGLKGVIQEESLRYFRESVVQVVIEEYNSSRAYLLGEVGFGVAGRGDGLYALEGRKTVLEFIIEHGGFTPQAAMTRVQLNRATGERLTLNMSDVIFQGDESQNVVVNPGDIVWVPSREIGANTYYVFGEVGSPGVVTTEENLSLVEVISRSGSFTPDADRDSVFIARGDVNNPEILRFDLKSLVEEADFSQNTLLRDNDVVFVPRRGLARYRDVIEAVAPLLGLLRDTVFLFQIR